MTQPGWYPDPAGQDGLRYWDGVRWGGEVRARSSFSELAADGSVPAGTSESLAASPAASAASPAQQPVGTASRQTRRPWLIVAVGLVLALIVGVLWWRPWNGSPVVYNTIDSTPTGSVWDESRPSPSGSTSSAASGSGSATVAPDPRGSRPTNCAPGTVQPAAPEQTDPLVSGRLSLKRPAGWDGPGLEARLPLAQAGYGFNQVLPEKLSWASSMTIGLLEYADYPGDVQAARTILQCVLTSDFYRDVKVSLQTYSTKQISVSGTPALQADALISFHHADLKTTGSRLRLIIVDTIPGRAFFFSAVPKENKAHIAAVEAATKSLQVV